MKKQIIYVPTLHASMAPKGLPEDVLFMSPGLPAADLEASSYMPKGLPYPPAEAKAVLCELVSMGHSFGSSGGIKQMLVQAWLEKEETQTFQTDEKRVLEAFAKTGATPPAVKSSSQSGANASALEEEIAEQTRNAQKILLLAWEHENCRLEIAALEEKIAVGDTRLQASFGEHSAYAEFPELAELGAAADSEETKESRKIDAESEYGWHTILAAIGAFLPDEAVLLSAHAGLAEELLSSGLLQPLPENLAQALGHWPEEFKASLLWARQPLWSILGFSKLPQGRPWLGKNYEIMIASKLVKA